MGRLSIVSLFSRFLIGLRVGRKRDERKIADKTKIDRIRSQQIREFCGFQSVNEKREKDNGTNM
jgi:hypothetical protein